MKEMKLFDDNEILLPDWINQQLKDVYSGLIIDLNKEQPFLFNVDVEFSELYEPSWLRNEMNLRILREIDNATLCPSGVCDLNDNEITFSIYEISSGAKALMICNEFDNVVIWGPIFGDNCTDILSDICKNKTVKIIQEHYLQFNCEKFKAFSQLLQREYKDYDEYRHECLWELVK